MAHAGCLPETGEGFVSDSITTATTSP
jgi:hypothetical protein